MATIKINNVTALTESGGAITLSASVTSYASGSAPGSPTAGQIYYDSTTNKLKVYRVSKWFDLDTKISDTVAATGGTVTSYTDSGTTYMVHTFFKGGSFVLGSTTSCDILLIGGGGGGATGNNCSSSGCDAAGAGGAGFVVWHPAKSLGADTYSVSIGFGGMSGMKHREAGSNTDGKTGWPSRFGDLFSAGGGGYGGNPNDAGGSGESPWGGSGGGGGGGGCSVSGGSSNSGTGNSGATTYKNRGGNNPNGIGSPYGGSGGGGAGSQGVDLTGSYNNPGSPGGDGIKEATSITAAQFTAMLEAADAGVIDGSYRYIAGGGGGGGGDGSGANSSKGGVGGKGGGGRGSAGNGHLPACDGVENTGSGGGGGGSYRLSAGNGSSGICIVRYAL